MTEYEDLDAQLRAWLDEDQSAAEAGESACWHIDYCDPYGPIFQDRFTSARMLADIAAKRALLDHVAAWSHELVDGDWWYSCSQAVLPDDNEPGSGCADEKRAGKPCDCGLDKRRLAVLRCIAAGYVDRAEFRPEWSIK
jgi:Family of unknown function (DUF6221)